MPKKGPSHPPTRGGQNGEKVLFCTNWWEVENYPSLPTTKTGVGENNCLKCDSPTHKFQERDKCIYGQSNLMSQPCSDCKRGAHHSSMCIKGTKSTIGAPPPNMPMDQEFSRWPENSKTAQENKEQFYTLFPKNEYIPSLFPE